ncbi:MAG: transposase [Acidobacteria bacterium]|nr:transposase [Acidobacteriota bacterium]
MHFYQRRLPHWEVIGQPLFVTFRLHGSLPYNRIFPPANVTSGKAFAAMDRILDQNRSGPVFLGVPEIAHVVVQALSDGETRFHRYQLHSYVVMPNHVHLLVTPLATAREWLGPLKGFTAREANRILGRTGQPFWQDESYDHLVRNGQEIQRILCYIEDNPVRAGLAASPEQFPWSSACRAEARRRPGLATPL